MYVSSPLSFVSAIADTTPTPCSHADAIVNEVFRGDFDGANYMLCLPVETTDFDPDTIGKDLIKYGRIIIHTKEFITYMQWLNKDRFSDINELKKLMWEILSGQRFLPINIVAYDLKFGKFDFPILYDDNKFTPIAQKDSISFLSKYCMGFSLKEKSFPFSPDGIAYKDYNYIIEALFNLNYLIAYSDGDIRAVHASCSAKYNE